MICPKSAFTGSCRFLAHAVSRPARALQCLGQALLRSRVSPPARFSAWITTACLNQRADHYILTKMFLVWSPVLLSSVVLPRAAPRALCALSSVTLHGLPVLSVCLLGWKPGRPRRGLVWAAMGPVTWQVLSNVFSGAAVICPQMMLASDRRKEWCGYIRFLLKSLISEKFID